MKRLLRFVAASAAALLVRVSLADDPSPYRLQVGDELDYWTQPDEEQVKTADVGHLGIWVVGQNADGGWKLLLTSKINHIMSGDENLLKVKDLVENRNGDFSSSGITVASASLTPRGQLQFASYLEDAAHFRWLLPPFPPRDAQLATPSEIALPGFRRFEDATFKVAAKSSTAQEWLLDVVKSTPLDALWFNRTSAAIIFDRDRGLVTSAKISSVHTQNGTVSGKQRYELKSITRHKPDEIARRAASLTAFANAMQRYRDAISELPANPELAAQANQRAADDLLAASKTMNDPFLAKTLEEDHRIHGIMTKSRLKFAAEWKQMEGKPAPPFTLPTLDDQKISLTDLRGKVVVLDFWFRACGPCMVAMPDVQQLADDFKGRPVVFLGMNIDENPADARLVVDTMRLSYPTLRMSQETASSLYKVQGYPTVMLIDPEGVIRRIPMTVNHDALKKEIESMIPQK